MMDDKKVQVELDIKRVDKLIGKATRDLDIGRVTALVELKSELKSVAGLMGQVDERLLLVQEIKSACQVDTLGVHVPPTDAENEKMAVRALLQYMDKDSLLKCRHVNPLWDSEVVRLLLKTTRSLQCDLNQLCKATEGIKTLRNLHLLLTSSRHPELLINTLRISKYTVERYNASPLNIPECKNILRNFGKHVTKLTIYEEKDFSIVSECLGQNGFCPNVQQLTVSIYSEDCTEEVNCFEQPFVKNLGMLQVQKLTFKYSNESVSNLKSLQAVLIVLAGILDNSPALHYLNIETKFTFRVPDPTDFKTSRVIQLLQSKPEVIKNLKEFRLEGNVLENIQSLSQLEFTSNLKTIHFEEEFKTAKQFKTTEKERNDGLKHFLKVVSPHLESLSLELRFVTSGITLSYIPEMPKLKELIYGCLKAEGDCSFLRNCPKLRKLELEHLRDPKIKTLQKFLEIVLKSENHSVNYVHDHLEEIHLDGRVNEVITNPKTLETLNRVFPHISRLAIAPIPPCGSWDEGIRHWFLNSFTFISQMKHLKSLTLDFSEWKCKGLAVDLNEPFAKLKDTPSLVHLTLEGFGANTFKTNLIASSLLALLGAPSLRRITFRCLQVKKDKNLKMKIPQLINDFEKSGILFEIENIGNN